MTLLDFPGHTPRIQVSVDAFLRRSRGHNMEKISSWLTWAVVLLLVALVVLVRVMGLG